MSISGNEWQLVAALGGLVSTSGNEWQLLSISGN